MERAIKIFALAIIAIFCGVSAHAADQLRLRMFADRNGDLFWMDTKSIAVESNGKAGATVYVVKGGYPSERQALSAACCGKTLATRAPEGTPAHFEFDCSGSGTYTVDRSAPVQAGPLSVAYNIAQFACAGARCKRSGMVCSE